MRKPRIAAVAALLVLSACGASASSPAPATGGVTNSAGVALTPSGSAPQSQLSGAGAAPNDLLAVAAQFYSASGTTCDAGAPSGSHHYARCPFTPQLQARYAKAAPDGQVSGDPAGGYAFLCHCQASMGGAQYAAQSQGSGGSVTIFIGTGSGHSGYVFTLTVVKSNGRLLISDIRLTYPPCSDAELDGCR